MSRLRGLFRGSIACSAGAMTVLAFAPFSAYIVAVLGAALVLVLWLESSPWEAFREGWWFGCGLLGTGVFWMHISIDQFGNLGTVAAIVLTLMFIAAMALYYAIAGLVLGWLQQGGVGLGGMLTGFSSLWVLSEWIRGWFLSGFPWLSLGYSQIDSPLAGWAPVLGVFGVSLAVTASASLLVLLWRGRGRGRVVGLIGLGIIWAVGGGLANHPWTSAAGQPLKVAVVQGNIPQSEKWQRELLVPTLRLYSALTREHLESDLIIWPETAVPAFVDDVEADFLNPLHRELGNQGVTLLTGIAHRATDGRYYNAMMVLGEGRDIYHKRHLVPFGEFLPLKSLLAPFLAWMQVPMSDFSAGEDGAPLVTLAGYPAGISICYEDAFGEEVVKGLPEAAFLVNASNDAWFGDSLALPQHLQIARMRARETGRYLLRATNTGISAIIAPDGSLASVSPAFERHVLSGEIRPMQGATPYVRWGNWAVIVFAVMLLSAVMYSRRRMSREQV
ncbi:MAG: apolipoprotein N-acyltransferase [Gammaproteobacteria bacterium]|nr:apolipoprotein N-acyltransferase [Gammaproteobacteria bacterium]